MKFFLPFGLLVLCIASSYGEETKMEKFGVVPDVLDKAPPRVIKATFGDAQADMGNVLTPAQVKHQPQVSWPVDPAKYYTLMHVDPDAPSRSDPKFREWQHWLVVNIPGVDVSKGEVLSEYVGAGPPKRSGIHRYVFIAYQQPGKMNTTDMPRLDNKSGKNRSKFSARKFAQNNNLGEPVAANFFQSEYESAAPSVI